MMLSRVGPGGSPHRRPRPSQCGPAGTMGLCGGYALPRDRISSSSSSSSSLVLVLVLVLRCVVLCRAVSWCSVCSVLCCVLPHVVVLHCIVLRCVYLLTSALRKHRLLQAQDLV